MYLAFPHQQLPRAVLMWGGLVRLVTCSDISGCQVECLEDWLHTVCLEDYCMPRGLLPSDFVQQWGGF